MKQNGVKENLNIPLTIEIGKSSVVYSLTLEHRINILNGNSGTGKSYILELINLFNQNNKTVSINTNNNIEIYTFNRETYKLYPQAYSKQNCLFIIDEDDYIYINRLIRSLHITSMILIISRKEIYTESINIKGVYKLEKLDNIIYNTPYLDKEPKFNIRSFNNYSTVIIEDSNSGYKFFQYFIYHYLKYDIPVLSSQSNVKIVETIKNNHLKGNILIIADGSDFGGIYFKLIKEIYKLERNINLYFLLPESFEYILLKSLFMKPISPLSDTTYYNDVELLEFTSGSIEKGAEKILYNITKDKYYEYKKSRLNKCYHQNCNNCENANKCILYNESNKFDLII